MKVTEKGYMTRREFFIAKVRPVVGSSSVTGSRFFEYQLKETKGSQTLYKEGKWFREKVLEDP